VANLSRTESRKNDFALKSKRIQNSFLMYPEILKAYQEFDWIRKRFDELARNTISLPSVVEMTANKFTIVRKDADPSWK
jgi:hypothetical protein